MIHEEKKDFEAAKKKVYIDMTIRDEFGRNTSTKLSLVSRDGNRKWLVEL